MSDSSEEEPNESTSESKKVTTDSASLEVKSDHVTSQLYDFNNEMNFERYPQAEGFEINQNKDGQFLNYDQNTENQYDHKNLTALLMSDPDSLQHVAIENRDSSLED